MKYIETPTLSRLAQSLSHKGPECSVNVRIEAYSCKNIKRDKRLFKALEDAYKDELSHSPPLPSWLALQREAEVTPFGPIDKHSSRKTLYLLISTLNIAFPDHEFSDVRPAAFSREPTGAAVLNALSTTLLAPHRAGLNAPRTYSSYPSGPTALFPDSQPTSSSPQSFIDSPSASPLAPPPIVTGTHPSIYRLVDDVIRLADCEVYSYTPELNADPHANDYSDDEEDVASESDDTFNSSLNDDDATFEFDDYDIDEHANQPPINAPRPIPPPPSAAIASSLDFSGHRNSGALLWSSHWFFLNRKQKRVLFISIWARSRGIGRTLGYDDLEYRTHDTYVDFEAEDELSLSQSMSERFFGWEGSAGAGARAMGLTF
ncbi:Maf1-domain-containing protein [Dendrothele bispora CBS 962.96]|uniref:Repressor of RNA polymerase III transcription MAF1 n=1 Tax=Dendrothele bispora (strain CBS 962.96) TaxID=1314807 RepID=A0A4S8MJE7_DENBC|nr:Maf1-domain-containing protein [Dendrothele bispora CBS 962.96]